MRIANPLYDNAFKYLMADNTLAKKVVSTILGQEVVSLTPQTQELVREGEVRGFSIFRLDFRAVIRLDDERTEQVAIELQKSRLSTNLARFRQYVAGLYEHQHTGKDNFEGLPIITIYILGYNLDDLPYVSARVGRRVVDMATGQGIEERCRFIESITHCSYVLQVKRLAQPYRNQLEHFLHLFNQVYVSEKNYILALDHVPMGFEDMARRLHKVLQDKEVMAKMTLEEEMELNFQLMEKSMRETQAALERIQEENAQMVREQAESMLKLAKALLALNYSLEQIVEETGLTPAQVEILKHAKHPFRSENE